MVFRRKNDQMLPRDGLGSRGFRFPFLFIAVCGLLLWLALFFCGKKEGFYIDELWSYGLANSTETPFLQDKYGYMENWHEPSFYREYLTVAPEETFSFGAVYNNQEQDVHPPLFYFFLHAVCSCFPERFSKWYGLAINLFFFAGTLAALYWLCGMLSRKADRFLPLVIYGVSAGALSCVIYIRMYMMLTFFAVVFAALIYRAMTSEGKEEFRVLAEIGLVCTAGMLTQYYFLVFAFFLSACYMLFRICRREWGQALRFAVSMGSGLILGTLFFPALLKHIFLGYKGKESLANAAGGLSYLRERLTDYTKLMADAFIWGKTVWLAAALAAAFLCILYGIYRLVRKSRRPNTSALYIGCIAFSAAAYFVVVAKISTDIVNRYQFLIFPFAAMLLAALFGTVSRLAARVFPVRTEVLAAVLTFGYVAAWLVSYQSGTQVPDYLYPGYSDALRLVEEKYKEVPGIYVTKGDHLVVQNCLFLSEQKNTYPLPVEKISGLADIIRGGVLSAVPSEGGGQAADPFVCGYILSGRGDRGESPSSSELSQRGTFV